MRTFAGGPSSPGRSPGALIQAATSSTLGTVADTRTNRTLEPLRRIRARQTSRVLPRRSFRMWTYCRVKSYPRCEKHKRTSSTRNSFIFAKIVLLSGLQDVSVEMNGESALSPVAGKGVPLLGSRDASRLSALLPRQLWIASYMIVLFFARDHAFRPLSKVSPVNSQPITMIRAGTFP